MSLASIIEANTPLAKAIAELDDWGYQVEWNDEWSEWQVRVPDLNIIVYSSTLTDAIMLAYQEAKPQNTPDISAINMIGWCIFALAVASMLSYPIALLLK